MCMSTHVGFELKNFGHAGTRFEAKRNMLDSLRNKAAINCQKVQVFDRLQP